MTPVAEIEEGRSARKRRAIMDAAAGLFLSQGYDGTSMDQVAAQAAVSKQTVYKQFIDKEHLFRDVILSVTGTVDAFIDLFRRTLASTDDVSRALHELARGYVLAVMQSRILRLRRLLIAESSRFSSLGRSYYERGPQRVVEAIAECFQALDKRGVLRVEDPQLAAQHYAFLVLAIPLDRALVCGDDALGTDELRRLADAGVDVFLRAYGRA